MNMNMSMGNKLLSAFASIAITVLSLAVVTSTYARDMPVDRPEKSRMECEYISFGPAHHPVRDRRVRNCEILEEKPRQAARDTLLPERLRNQ